ncbi:MAG TPA: CdaR family protein [Humisphaera sp.]|nr:CdaR family protein [Humisphaera sp.]
MTQTTVQPPPKKLEYRTPPPRPKRSLVKRFAQSFRNKLRTAFSREKIKDSLKSLAWVVPMTILIWVYAEREQVGKQTVIIHVEPRNSDSSRVIELTPGPDGRPRTSMEVRADLSGPNARLQQVASKLAGIELSKDVDPKLAGGVHALSLSDLTYDPLFVTNGISVANMSPPEMVVKIDPIQQVTLPVTIRPTITNLEGPAVFQPATVHVSGPRSVLEAARKEDKLVVYADLGNLTEPGARTILNVPLSVPIPDSHVTVMPANVQAQVTVKRSDVDGIVNSMPVFQMLPPPNPFWQKYEVVYQPSIFNVKVTGPADMIQKINDPSFDPKPKARFDVTTATPQVGPNPQGVKYTAKLHFDFGETGLKISPDDSHDTIEFTVVEREK